MRLQNKILIVEHSLSDIELIIRELKTGGIEFITEIVQNEIQYRNKLEAFLPDIILCDYSLPSFDGNTAFEIREEVAADIPFIFVSGSIGEENSIEYIKKGVTDYVLKDRLITLVIKVKRALTDAKEKRDKSKINNGFRQALKDLQKIMTASLDVICAINKEGNFVNVSSAAESIFGFRPEELKGRNYIDFVFPDDVNYTLLAVADIMNGNPITFFENRYIKKNGNIIPVLWSATWDDDDKLMYCIVKDATERIKAEQQREFDQNNLSALINNTKDLMWSVDRNFKLITSNKSFDDALIPMAGRLIAKGDSILNPNFSTKQTVLGKRVYERVFEGKSFTEIIYGSTPSETWSEISYCPIKNDNKVIGVACHSRDITQLKINERTIVDERILLRTVIDNLPAIIYTKDIYSRKTLANRADYQYLGAETEDYVLGKDDANFFSNEAACKTAIEEQQIFNTGQPIIDKEEHQTKKDGSKAWFLKSKIPLRNQQHEIVGLVGISQDITERKKIEEQLKKSETFNRSVLNSLSSHIAVINADGNIIAVNEAWKQFDMENDSINLHDTGVGSNYYEVCKRSGAAGLHEALEVLQGMKDVMDEKVSFFQTEYPCDSPDEQRWFNLRVMKFESDDAMIVVSHQDITERKLAEFKLEEQNTELIKINFELDRLVYSVSHELRAPLTSVSGLVSFIEDESKEENILEYAAMIRASINRLYSFIKNILSYSRNKRLEPEMKEIPVIKTITEIVDSLCYMKEAEGINFEVNIQENTSFFSDPLSFKTITENLISNAIKFQKSELSGRFIKISGHSDKCNFHFRVEDNGIGIPSKYHGNIFQMFFRLSGKTGGSGIGLYILKEMVDKLQGSVRFESQEDVGTTFIVQLKNLNTNY